MGAQLRATGGSFLHLFTSPNNIKLDVDPSNYQNLTYLHALVTPKESPKVHLKSLDMVELLEYDEKLDMLISSILSGNTSKSQVIKNQGLTNLDLLSVAVPFTIADATCDTSYHRSHMDENIHAFGQKGADNVQSFKTNYLNDCRTKNLAAYKLEEPF